MPRSLFAKRRIQISLRSFFAVLAIAAILIGLKTHRAQQQKKLVDQLRADGFMVLYDGHGPEWLARLAGLDFAQSVTEVEGYH